MIETLHNPHARSMVCPVTRTYAGVEIPEDWDTIEDFVNWFMSNKLPILVPHNASVFRTDDATAICIFRHKRYQVEFYIIHPYMVIPYHSHPGLEVLTVLLGGGSTCGPEGSFGTSMMAGMTAERLSPGQYHGKGPTENGTGFGLLSFEKWDGNIPMLSAATQWEGETAGPIHSELLEKYYPGSVTRPGYADVRVSPIYSDFVSSHSAG